MLYIRKHDLGQRITFHICNVLPPFWEKKTMAMINIEKTLTQDGAEKNPAATTNNWNFDFFLPLLLLHRLVYDCVEIFGFYDCNSNWPYVALWLIKAQAIMYGFHRRRDLLSATPSPWHYFMKSLIFANLCHYFMKALWKNIFMT